MCDVRDEESETFDCEEFDLEDEESLINNYWSIPTPKSSKSTPECLAFNDVIAKNNADVLDELCATSLDDCIDNSLETYSLVDMFRGHRKPAKLAKTKDLRPMAIGHLATRDKGKSKPAKIRVLFDSGASNSLVSEKHVSKLKHTKTAVSQWSTPAGSMTTNSTVDGKLILPEFHDGRVLKWKFHVSKTLGAYDMIVGRDLMKDLGMDIRFSDETIEWADAEVPFRDANSIEADMYYVGDSDMTTHATSRMKDILGAKYEAADLGEVARSCTHLSEEEREMLRVLLHRYEDLFDGNLGTWRGQEHDLELKPDAKPYHARAYPIPQVHVNTLKVEVERLCKIGVLKRVNRSEWAAPTFIIPKKDGTVRFISDFRELNKRIRRKPYPIPKIQDLLIKLEGFQYATSLDLNMGYYHIELSPASKKLCTIVLPFGKFEYQRLPMGLCNSPDIFQEKMSELMADLEYTKVYIDDLLCLTKGNLADHLEKLEEVFLRLRTAGLKVNAKKSFFARGELEYLGYWITRDGIQPLPDKVDAIHRIKAPKTKKQLRSFIGIINYYRDMWVRRSHVLAPLAQLTSKTTKWKWNEEHQKAFDDAKKIIAKETLLAYPDFNKPFIIHTDASHLQLGAVISQDKKPIAFYSRKLNPAQTRYTTTERELLSIVETLKEFRNILLGHKIVVYTDHKNLTYKTFNTERVMRWRLVLEEYGPELRYIKGENNVVADALSRLDCMSEEEYQAHQIECFSADMYANDIEDGPDEYPLTFEKLHYYQQQDEELQKRADTSPEHSRKQFAHGDKSFELITRHDKICVPKDLQLRAIEWYHTILMHPGETRTELTIGQHFFWKGMKEMIARECKRCQKCQFTKRKYRKLAKIPPKNPEAIPWERCCIDLIGPYDFGKKNTPNHIRLHCLTMIDPATGWFEIVTVTDRESATIANAFEQAWLSKYPWPQEVVMDRGTEFMGLLKTMLREDYGVTRKVITTRNPQANAMVERAHKTLHEMVRTVQVKDKRDLPNVLDQWAGVLSSVGFAMRSTVHTTNRATPAQLVFNRDAIHNVRFEADWQYIRQRKQRRILQNNKQENKNRVEHTYAVGDRVLVEQDMTRKHGQDRYQGPYRVAQVYQNGTVQLEYDTPRGGVLSQRWNVRKLFPYRD